MPIDETFLQELRSRTDITELISSYVDLGRRQGRTQKGLCPFHNEKTPSFMVYEDTSSFYCFGCGAGGDAITFLMKIENLDYIEAVKLLAQRAGLAMPEDGYDDSLLKKKKRILAANREAAKFYHNCLLEEKNKFALDYFLNRGLSPSTIKHFGLGYAPDSWDSLIKYMREKGFSASELYEADLVKKSTKNGERFYDNFRNRMMTPIIDLKGNVIGFGGRVLDDSKPKYVNTADTLVYKKSNEVFALNFAKNGNNDSLIVAEGYMDVIALHQAGFTNSVACLGTALTKEQARLIKRYANEVILSYDSDEAGQKATQRALQIFGETGIAIRVLNLSGGKDPDEIIKKYGKERFASLINGAANDIEFNIIKCRNKYDVSTSDGKMRFLTDAAGYLSTVSSPIRRDTYVSRLSEETGVSKDAINGEINRKIAQKRRSRSGEEFKQARVSSVGTDDKINPEKKDHLVQAKAEEILITTLFKNPDFWIKLKDKVSYEDFVTSFNKRVFKELTRRLEEGLETELTMFIPLFNEAEMGRITRLKEIDCLVGNSIEECIDCINVLKKAKDNEKRKNPAEMSNDDFLDGIRKMKNKNT